MKFKWVDHKLVGLVFDRNGKCVIWQWCWVIQIQPEPQLITVQLELG